MQTQFWHKTTEDKIQCDVCSRFCNLRPNQRGFCYVRQNFADKIELDEHAIANSFGLDPIEKKPLYHFYPKSKILSFGSSGCNLSCKFCQNWSLSKARISKPEKAVTPTDVINFAHYKNCSSIAFTYNDPVIFLEYANETAKLCKLNGLKSVVVTAGNINQKPREFLFKNIDATNVDLKGFTEHFYKKICGSSLNNVLETLNYIKHETNVWLEVTNLLIEGYNDSEHELQNMCQWLVDNLGVNTPLHFSAFHPDFKLQDAPKTSLNALQKAKKIAKNCGVNFVYIGNVLSDTDQNTYCVNCNELLIERSYYNTKVLGIKNIDECMNCNAKLVGRF